MSDLADLVIKSLEDEYKDFDKTMVKTNEHRQFLLDTTRKALENVDLAKVDIEKFRSIEGFANLVSAYSTAIDGVEKKAATQVTLKLKLKDSMRADNASLAVRDLLEMLNSGVDIEDSSELPLDLEEQSKLVEQRVTLDNLPPIEEWETKTDPNDLTT